MYSDGEDEEQHCSPEAEAHPTRLSDVSNHPRVVALSPTCCTDRLQRDLAVSSPPAERHSRADAGISEVWQSLLLLSPKADGKRVAGIGPVFSGAMLSLPFLVIPVDFLPLLRNTTILACEPHMTRYWYLSSPRFTRGTSVDVLPARVSADLNRYTTQVSEPDHTGQGCRSSASKVSEIMAEEHMFVNCFDPLPPTDAEDEGMRLIKAVQLQVRGVTKIFWHLPDSGYPDGYVPCNEFFQRLEVCLTSNDPHRRAAVIVAMKERLV